VDSEDLFGLEGSRITATKKVRVKSMSKDPNFTRLPPIDNKIFTIDEKDEESALDRKHFLLKRIVPKKEKPKDRDKEREKDKKELPKEDDKFMSKGFKLRFFIEKQNGF